MVAFAEGAWDISASWEAMGHWAGGSIVGFSLQKNTVPTNYCSMQNSLNMTEIIVITATDVGSQSHNWKQKLPQKSQ